MPTLLFSGWNMMHTVVLKDKKNKEAHEQSARLACEAAAAVKTVASLTREQSFVDAYSKSLEEPLRVANRSTIVGMFWFGCTQSTIFLVNALVGIESILFYIATSSFLVLFPRSSGMARGWSPIWSTASSSSSSSS
jgi:ABC transporter transmembrane region